jgi:hypothetical protein
MTCMNASARIGFVILVATILTAAICGDAAAKAHKGRLHARSLTSQSRAAHAQFMWEQPAPPASPAPMRYYGGPKSPMWRG